MYILLQFYLNFLVEIMIKSFFELCRLLSRKRYIIRHSSLVGWEGYFLLNLMICDMKGSGQSEPIPSPEKRPTRIVYRSPTCRQQWRRSVAQVTTALSLISLGWANSNHILVSTSFAYRRILCWSILIQIIMLIMARKRVYFAWKPRSELRILEQRYRIWRSKSIWNLI